MSRIDPVSVVYSEYTRIGPKDEAAVLLRAFRRGERLAEMVNHVFTRQHSNDSDFINGLRLTPIMLLKNRATMKTPYHLVVTKPFDPMSLAERVRTIWTKAMACKPIGLLEKRRAR